jgi:phage shock protein PspC (stress-responsive transcriptional regulator)
MPGVRRVYTVDDMNATRPRLVRPRHGRRIAGVCAGLAHRFGISPFLMRLLFVLSCLLPGPQFVIYIALWIIVPNDDKVYSHR